MARGTLLLILAHPDDEAFGHGGTIARYHHEGVTIALLMATRGEHGTSSHPSIATPEMLGQVREQETREAAALLGIDEVAFLGLKDGAVSEVGFEHLAGLIETHMRRIDPDVVITFGPHGITQHPDHVIIGRAATAVFHRQHGAMGRPKRLYYAALSPERAAALNLPADSPEAHPTTAMDVTAFKDLKIAALRAHRSQRDAQERAEAIAGEDQLTEYLYRAYPPVAPEEPLEHDIFPSALP
jgi:LmbE family N-acetylglucosaminyl deacetylase